MKKLYFIFAITLIMLMGNSFNTIAQAPEGFTYQAEARDGSGKLLVNKALIVKTTILVGSATGDDVWDKNYNVTTDKYGLFSIVVGDAGYETSFSEIEWGMGKYFLNVKIKNGTTWINTGTTQLLSVPYALYAKSAGSAKISETDPVFTSSQAVNITESDITNLSNLSGTNTGDQNISAMSHANRVALDAVAGINTGDQDMSGLATTAAVTTSLNLKVDKETGKALSTEDYTTVEKTKLAGIAAGAEVNVNADWNVVSGDAQILNKPTTVAGFGITDAMTTAHPANSITSDNIQKWNDESLLWKSESGDVISSKDVICQSNIAIGFDAVPGESFGFATVILKENNTRIKFDDTSGPGFTANDWQLNANEAVSGGLNCFEIQDITGNKIPFKLLAGAPTNSFYMNSNGFVGFGTSTPARKVHISDVMRLQPSTEPADPGAGDLYFDLTTNKLRYFDGSQWNATSGYLTSFTETDPEFTAWDKSTDISITESQISDLGNYIETETDPAVAAKFDFSGALSGDLLKFDGSKFSKFTPNYLLTENQNLTNVLSKGTDAGNQKIVNVNQLGVGTLTPSASAAIEINSTTQGFLPPRMTNSQMAALTPVEGLMIYNTTAKSPMFYNGTDWMKIDGSAYLNLYIGKSYQGGIIAYIFQAGDPGYVGGETHGLIVAPSDQPSAEWGCYGTAINGADGIALGTGKQNTIDIVNGNTDDLIVFAAQICANLTISGYSDWFLPSKNELNIIFQNRTANMNFSHSEYWTSTESSAHGASSQYMGSGNMYDDNNKGAECLVRAIRAF